jgi:hypothetical protein
MPLMKQNNFIIVISTSNPNFLNDMNLCVFRAQKMKKLIIPSTISIYQLEKRVIPVASLE